MFMLKSQMIFFVQALNARPDHWDKISCDQESIPMNERYEYDTSEGITSIVNSVNTFFQTCY